MRPAPEKPREDLHLVACPHCGTLNGLNASRCWSCEQALPAVEAGAAAFMEGPAEPTVRAATEDSAHHRTGDDPPAAPPQPEDARAALDRAFAPLRNASAVATRRRHRWLAGGAVAAAAALVVLGYPLYQAPVALSLDPANRGATPPRPPDAADTAPSPTLATAPQDSQAARDRDATHPAPDAAVRSTSGPAPSALAQRSRASAAVRTRAEHDSAAASPRVARGGSVERSGAVDRAPAEAMPDPAVALGLARTGAATDADASTPAEARMGTAQAPAAAGARRVKAGCAVAAAALGLCERDSGRR